MKQREQLIYLVESGAIPYEKLLYWYSGQRSLKLSAKEARRLQDFKNRYPWSHFEELYYSKKISPLILGEHEYPYRLSEIYRPPLVIFCRGDLQLLKTRCLSVVGSRKMSNYGQQMVQNIIPEVSSQLTIVSGLALGVDGEAHRMAIRSGGRTIAVIGSGLGSYYPAHHRKLQEYIENKHLLISPLPYYAGVRRWHFPYRNRTIAGLSSAVLVVEAARKSGSLITANYALQENRDVLAIPGALTQPLSAGCNELIQAGAKMILTGRDILEEYHSQMFDNKTLFTYDE